MYDNVDVKWLVRGPTHQVHACRRSSHDDVIKWKHFPRYWPFVRGIHRSPVNSPHKGQWRGALMFSLICVWINGWVNNGKAGDLRRYRAHYDVSVMNTLIDHGNNPWKIRKQVNEKNVSREQHVGSNDLNAANIYQLHNWEQISGQFKSNYKNSHRGKLISPAKCLSFLSVLMCQNDRLGKKSEHNQCSKFIVRAFMLLLNCCCCFCCCWIYIKPLHLWLRIFIICFFVAWNLLFHQHWNNRGLAKL